ncbi:MAG: hypothetical protein K1X81_13265 [Bacteroidia bacterium]|nr:hypothetical protein [Bacteroidia bacterium]
MKPIYNFFIIITSVLYSCNNSGDPSFENKIILTNLFNQEVTGTFYWSHETFTIPVNGTYTYIESGDGAGSFSFGESDSVIIRFKDGKQKTDYCCADINVISFYPDCAKDSINLFKGKCYKQIRSSENKFVSYYNISQADYDEAK